MSDAMSEPPVTRRWQRGLLLALSLVAVVHSAVLMFWLAPSSPVRDSIGESRLETYVNPYFGQSWGALAPNAQFVDEAFRFRAHVEDDETGKKRVTEWVDVTDEDSAALRHSLDPARVHTMAGGARDQPERRDVRAQRRAAQARQDQLHLDTREHVGGSAAAQGNYPAVRAYLAYDQMATRFASMYAKARFGGKDPRGAVPCRTARSA
ncbi:DUF5819 family protein [Aeromicrobium sp. UC242_57]|uniref:DUF5819 family protein n=1 Tax=Aeromicrobium sp. UC242_57 TaxID=3374624 RepID=UPI00378980CF